MTTDPAPNSNLMGLVTLLLVAGVLAALLLGDGDRGSSDGSDQGAAALAAGIKKDRYQAIYLDNERVYFGRLRALEGDWFTVEDAFFIRQREAKDGKEASSEVVRITEEVAQPQKDLLVHAESIDMVQNLSSTSSVAAAIDDVVK